MHQTSTWSDKSSSSSEQLKDNKCAPPPQDAPLLHAKCSLWRMKAKPPWITSPCKLQATKSLSSSSQGFYSNPHEVHPPPCKCSWTRKDGYGSMDELTMQAPSSKSFSQTLKGFGSNPMKCALFSSSKFAPSFSSSQVSSEEWISKTHFTLL